MINALLTCAVLCLGISLGSVLSPPCAVQHNSPVNWTVDCSGHSTNAIPTNLQGQPVTKLILNRNNFNSSLIFRNWTYLREIDLSFNHLSHVPQEMFMEYDELKRLNLSSNEIKNISGEHFVNKLYVESLDLSNNTELAMNEQFLQDLLLILRRGVKFLYLGKTGLTSIPRKYFDEVYELKFLDLRRNNLDKLPKFTSSLIRLDISENLYERLTLDSFGHCVNLEILIIEKNANLEFLDNDVFHTAKKLTTLSLRGNKKLLFLPEILFFHNHLKYLDLTNCGFQTLSPNFLKTFERMNSIDLRGNPWHCDHRLGWLRKLNTSVEGETIRCANSNTTFSVFYGSSFTHALLWNILIGLLCFNLVIFGLFMWCTYSLGLRARLNHVYSPLDDDKTNIRNPLYVSTVV